MARSRYRPEIDGLRAIAVLAIVLFHASVPGFAGGFVGVDVFFVISGYLITDIVRREIDAGQFSLIGFYERRVRRLAPALTLMVAVVLCVSLLLLPASPLKQLAASAVSALTFTANIFFMLLSGSYFDAKANFRPLQHLWSLGVEEQFYLLFPVLLLVAMRRLPGWGVLMGMLGVLLASLALSVLTTEYYPKPAFYLLHTRAWEFLAGGVLAYLQVSAPAVRWQRELLAWSGLLAIAASTLLFTEAIPFPGSAALLPVFGTALVIFAAGGTSAGSLLGLGPLVLIGAASYSIYLWHWPIVVFIRSYTFSALGPAEIVLAVTASLAAGWLSWKWVEQPFRDRSRIPRARMFQSFVAATVVVGLLPAVIWIGDGFPGRRNLGDAELVSARAAAHALQASTCLSRGADLPGAVCVLGRKDGAPSAVLWGDSHAAQLAPALDMAAAGTLGIRQITKAGCAPIVATAFFPIDAMRSDCAAFNAKAYDAILADKDISLVYLAARWDVFASGDILVSDSSAKPTVAASRTLTEVLLNREIAGLLAAGKQVIVVGQVPLPDLGPSDCVERTAYLDRPAALCLSFDFTRERARAEAAEQLVQASLPTSDRLRYIPAFDLICPGDCTTSDGGRFLYMDADHLSPWGAMRIVTRMLEAK